MKKPKSFEEGVQRLEEVLDKLASAETPLNESVKLYTEAAALLEYCTTVLNNAKLQMEQIDLHMSDVQE